MLTVKQSGENFIIYDQGQLRKPLRIIDICEAQELHSALAYSFDTYEEFHKNQEMQPCPLYVDPNKNCQALKDHRYEQKTGKSAMP